MPFEGKYPDSIGKINPELKRNIAAVPAPDADRIRAARLRLFHRIVETVSLQTDIAPVAILGRSRSRPVAAARRQVMVACYAAGLPVYAIAKMIKRDCTPVRHAIRRCA
jgi:chromosomal replication initiation ATPase DnaA